jgi:exonuclease III
MPGARRDLERQLGQAAAPAPAAVARRTSARRRLPQETKLADAAFDELLAGELAARGYAVARHGEAQQNGGAILSRSGLEEVTVGIPGAPGFPHREARALSARCGGIRVHSDYVPNGRIPDSDHYRYRYRSPGSPRFATSSARRRRRRWSAAT